MFYIHEGDQKERERERVCGWGEKGVCVWGGGVDFQMSKKNRLVYHYSIYILACMA